jgi:hypothetical protein
MLFKICGVNETDNPVSICDDWKFCIFEDKEYSTEFVISYTWQVL